MTLLNLILLLRIIFLVALGIHLLAPNKYCKWAAALSGFVLAGLIVLGKF